MIIRLCRTIYTYTPLLSGKLTWPQKILEASSDFPHCSGGRMMPWVFSLKYFFHKKIKTIDTGSSETFFCYFFKFYSEYFWVKIL